MKGTAEEGDTDRNYKGRHLTFGVAVIDVLALAAVVFFDGLAPKEHETMTETYFHQWGT